MPRVLFVHGLESGPVGRKSLALTAAGFDVVSEQMPCGRAHVVSDPVVIGGAIATLSAAAFSARRGSLLGFLGLAAVVTPFARIALLRRVFSRSVEVQRPLLRRDIDVVVGSSFGGAITLELLQRRLWEGPTLLLCPAQDLIVRGTSRPLPAPLADLGERAKSVVIVHGTRDETVPIAHSRRLVRGSRAELIEVDDDHRLTASATPENLAEWVSLCMERAG